MKYEDHILARHRAFDQVAAWQRITYFYEVIMRMRGFNRDVLLAAMAMRREFRALIRAIDLRRRRQLKLQMLRTPEWRQRVINDLGGVEVLLRWWRRNAQHKSAEPIPTRDVKLSQAEHARRAHIRLCAKETANPHICRDPFKVDQEGQFRLPPLKRNRGNIPPRKSVMPYQYDARPFTTLTGFETPISVWPEEFLLFAEMEVEVSQTKSSKVGVKNTWVMLWYGRRGADVKPDACISLKRRFRNARAPPENMRLRYKNNVALTNGATL